MSTTKRGEKDHTVSIRTSHPTSHNPTSQQVPHRLTSSPRVKGFGFFLLPLPLLVSPSCFHSASSSSSRLRLGGMALEVVVWSGQSFCAMQVCVNVRACAVSSSKVRVRDGQDTLERMREQGETIANKVTSNRSPQRKIFRMASHLAPLPSRRATPSVCGNGT